MTLDEKLRATLDSEASAVPAAEPASVTTVMKRGARRRLGKRIGWGFLALVVFLGFAAVAVPFDPNAIDPAQTSNVETVEIADLAVTVTDARPVLSDPDVWIGSPGPTPRFDTTAFGPDLSFRPGEPSIGDLGEKVSRAVYLGDLDGEPFYVYSHSAPSILDWFLEFVDGNFSGQMLGTSLGCCSGGDMDSAEGLPGLITLQEFGEFSAGTAEWLGLSPDVSVVAYRIDDVFVGWQTPVGGVSSISLDHSPDEFLFITYDADGKELDRFGGTMPGIPDGDQASTPATTAVPTPATLDLSNVPTPLEILADSVVTDEEWRVAGLAVVQCLDEQGIEASFSPEEGSFSTGGTEQQFSECWGMYMGVSVEQRWADQQADPIAEFFFYRNVVECTEQRTGIDFGEMTQDNLGFTSSEAKLTINRALDEAPDVYMQCFDEIVQES